MENEIVQEKKPFPLRKTIIISLVVLVLISIVGLNVYRAKNKDVVKVQTAEVKAKALVENVLASGKVSALEKDSIYSRVTGSISMVNVKMGQEVKAGQVLMELDIPDAGQKVMQARSTLAAARAALLKAPGDGRSSDLVEAQTLYDKAESEYTLAEEKLKRNQALFDAGAISLSEMETVKSSYASAKSDYQRTKTNLSGARNGSSASLESLQASVDSAQEALKVAETDAQQQSLKAAMAGRVLSIPVEKGDRVVPSTLLISIGELSTLKIKADIAEGDAGKMRIGQPVKITAAALPDQTFTGKVSEVGLEAVSKTKSQGESTSVPVVVNVKGGGNLLPGYNVDLRIRTAQDKHALVVPFEALVEKNGKTCVYVIRDGKAHQQVIKTGISDSTHIQVLKGLRKGEKVVINPSSSLKDGSVVKL